MIAKAVRWLVGSTPVERLLLAATVVAGLRMMLIHAVFIGFDLDVWPWFKAVEVLSGLAFAVLEGKALAYVSRLWVGLRPERGRPEQWLYWGVLAVGQLLLLGSIIGVTAYAAASVRRETGIDALLGDGEAVAWSMFVTALNPLMVVLIGIARAIDPTEQQVAQVGGMDARRIWPPLDIQLELFLAEYDGPALDPPALVERFEAVSGQRITLSQAETALIGDGDELTMTARRESVQRMLAESVPQAEMARRLGVHPSTIKRDVAAVRNGTG